MNTIIRFKIFWLLAIAFMLSLQVTLAQEEDSSEHSLELQEDEPLDTIFSCSVPPFIEASADSMVNGLADRGALWKVGATLRVKFLDGSTFHKNKVKQYAVQWEQYANIKLQFVESGDAEIRISFAQKGRFYSQIGTDALFYSQKNHTMNLGFTNNEAEASYSRLVLHEFGHAIGLHHEHLHPESNIQWNKPAVYDYFAAQFGWPQSQVDANLFAELPISSVHYCTYDPSSIMHYFVLNSFTLNNFSVGNNTKLSPEDKSFIQKIYPNGGVRADPICQDACTNCDNDFTLTTKVQGQGTITVSPSSSNNANCTSSCTGTYSENQEILLRAVPKSGYQFVKWEGTRCNGSISRSCDFTMTTNHSVTAVFEAVIPSRKLAIAITGKGSVITKVGNAIRGTCTDACNYTFSDRTNVNITAMPETGYRFVRWEGGACNSSSNSTCSFTISESLNIKAIFEKIVRNKTLIVAVNGSGSITTTTMNIRTSICANTCSYSLSEGTNIQLTATPATGHQFMKWEGGNCNNISNNNCIFALSENLSIKAIFEPIPPTNNQVSLQIVGSGKVIISDNIDTQICDKDCVTSYPPNSTIDLWAQAAEGYRFDKWESTICEAAAVSHCNMILTNSQNIKAIFEPIGTPTTCLEFTANSTNSTCNTGKVSVKITTGTAPYEIKINGPITGDATTNNKSFRIEELPAGTYDITLEDAAGCKTTEQFIINDSCRQGDFTGTSTSRSRILQASTQNSIYPIITLRSVSKKTINSEELPVRTAISPLQQTESIARSNSSTGRCGTSGIMKEFLENPANAQQYQEKKQVIYEQPTQARGDCTKKKVLPIAIHFQGIANANRSCLEALSRRQIQILNEDIQGRNKEIAKWKNEVSNYFPNTNYGATCLEFCIATKNHPAGFGLRDGDLAVTINETKGNSDRHWSGYINIFVRSIDYLGFSPVGGSGNGDGIVIDVAAFSKGTSCGSIRPTAPYNLGRTLTHEVGHYFLLSHIWGDGCSTDDRLNDTPNAAGPNYGCPQLGVSTCGSTDLHVNYMDYTNDACLYMFTEGQSMVMENYVDRFLSRVTNNASRVCEAEEPVEQNIEHDLAITLTGSGSVWINAANSLTSSCASNCTNTFEEGMSVQLRATPNDGYRFVKWTGTDCNNSTSIDCAVRMTKEQSITALFEIIPPTMNSLGIEIVGAGTVETSVNNTEKICISNCNFDYMNNSSIQLIATPAAGYRFMKWEGDACDDSTNTSCSFTLTENVRIKAVFEAIPLSQKSLEIEIIGSGTVEATANNATKACTSSCTFKYIENSMLSFVAKPAPGYRFNKWLQGTCNSMTTTTCEMLITDDQQLIAVFEKDNTLDPTCMEFTAKDSMLTCNTGAVSIRVASGVAPFSIKVNGPITGDAMTDNKAFRIEDLPIGSYDITLTDANECESTEQFTIVSNCGQTPETPVSTSRNTIDATDQLLVLTIEEEPVIRMRTNDFQLCMALPLDSIPPQERIEIESEEGEEEVAHAVAERNRLWEVGQTIKVRFFGGDITLRQKIRQAAKEWEKYANIRFDFVETGQAHIRIGFNKKINNSSQIGSEALLVEENRMTMNFSLTNKQEEDYIWWVIRHEFGHALGLLHEHVHPENNIPWDKEAVYAYQKDLTREEVDQIFFDLPAKDKVYFCDYDKHSVMHYSIGNESTYGDFFSTGYNVISKEDQRFVGELYPFSGDRNSLAEGFCEEANTPTNQELKIRVDGEGAVKVMAVGTTTTCQSCTFVYANTLTFELEVIPAAGHRLKEWIGNYCAGRTSPNCQFSINTNETIRAVFEPIPTESSCLNFTVSSSNTSCNKGKISIAITKGTAPFDLAIEGPISGEATTSNTSFRLEQLVAGDYTIILQDAAGCETKQAFSIENTCTTTTNNFTNSSRHSTRITNEWIISEELEEAITTASLTVGANYPNPFRERTTLPFQLAKDGAMQLEIFYSNGQRVYQKTQFFEAGKHQVQLGTDVLQKSGLYIYHLQMSEEVVIGKMIRL